MIKGISLSLLSKEKVLWLSRGEVSRPTTFDPRTQLPDKNGLFCQRIFGSYTPGVCLCGKFYKDYRKKKIKCAECGTEVTNRFARRQRFGHITFATPIVHPWFRSIIALLLNIPSRKLDALIEYKSFMVTNPKGSKYKKGDIVQTREYLSGGASFKAEAGGSLIQEMLSRLNFEDIEEELKSLTPSRRVNRRLQAVRAFRKSGIKPELMVLDAILVLPPDLRPILFLEDGTTASSDLNELYLKVIRRNNRLKRFKEHRAPELLLSMEKAGLQSALDALFQNKKTKVKDRAGKRELKSLTDMVSGKEGRLRRNLLGKRVDFSGRSVIVSGPELKLHQCGLPLSLAMDIFKPFVYGRLIRTGIAVNLNDAKVIVEKRHSSAIAALEHEIAEKVVLLNRAPTLHRAGIQAFDVVLVSGKAIRLHPLVCSAFNADFDGDQMGVHLPLSINAQIESRLLMMSTENMVSPGTGKVLFTPSQDIALGIYCLTMDMDGQKGEGMTFADKEDVVTAYDLGAVELNAKVTVRIDGEKTATTPGRVIFSNIFPPEIKFKDVNKTIKKKDLSQLIDVTIEKSGKRAAVELVDLIKELGFKHATLTAVSFCIDDVPIPGEKKEIIAKTEAEVEAINAIYKEGRLSKSEKHNKIVDLWIKADADVSEAMVKSFTTDNSLFMMADSGARGSADQIKQIGGMRGLMAKTTGEIVEQPIRSNFKEGLSYHEFLLSSHGARKGRADTAMKTSTAGYFTRKLVDASHDVIVNGYDCGSMGSVATRSLYDKTNLQIIPLSDRLYGRVAAKNITNDKGGVIVKKNDFITREQAEMIALEGIDTVAVRSPSTCELKKGVCVMCYGFDLSTKAPVAIGEAVGIIAAQSIGEPGTQLTLRAFHAGGIASKKVEVKSAEAQEEGRICFQNIKYVNGDNGALISENKGGQIILKRAGKEKVLCNVPAGTVIYVTDGQDVKPGQQIAEWDPFNILIVSKVDGVVSLKNIIEGVTAISKADEDSGIIRKVISDIRWDAVPKIAVGEKEHVLPVNAVLMVKDGDSVKEGSVLARIPKEAVGTSDIAYGLTRVLQVLEAREPKEPAVLAELSGKVRFCPPKGKNIEVEIVSEAGDVRKYMSPVDRQLNFYDGDYINAGDVLVSGTVDLSDILRVIGRQPTVRYIVDEVQKVYREQGIEINDKHIEVIAGKMLGLVRVTKGGDTDMTTGDLVKRETFLKTNKETIGKKATAAPAVMGITDVASLSESWLSAASFQRTSSALARAAITGQADYLDGIKENVITGLPIPAGTGHRHYENTVVKKETAPGSVHEVNMALFWGNKKN